MAERLARGATSRTARPLRQDPVELLGRLSMHPVWGIPILLAVVYFGLYLVVGKLGAGVAVNFLERLFQQHFNPAVTTFVQHLLPWPALSSLFVGQFGVFTLGVRYAFAIVLPLVGSFFLMFALLEDSGYLPRLAILVDRMFKRIGLSGRAVIPLVLGLGCDTMATLVTRVLESRRERVIATFLLALAIPCSAQLGVMLGLLAGHPLALAIWAGVVLGVFLLSGFLAARVVPGGGDVRFSLEIPPLRAPLPSQRAYQDVEPGALVRVGGHSPLPAGQRVAVDRPIDARLPDPDLLAHAGRARVGIAVPGRRGLLVRLLPPGLRRRAAL